MFNILPDSSSTEQQEVHTEEHPKDFSVREAEDDAKPGEKCGETQLSPSVTEQLLWEKAGGSYYRWAVCPLQY